MTGFGDRHGLGGPLRVLALLTTVLLAAGGVAELVSASSCTSAATNNPLRSFDGAKNIDVVCMQTLANEDGGSVPPVPLNQAACTPVPTGVTGSLLPNHLFALVTQFNRGEVAVVDLTSGLIVDEDLSTPGTNFLPVGQAPTGIASSADGKMTYVAAAEVNKPAIYALPSTLILGNSQELEAGTTPTAARRPTPPVLTTWPVCALPQAPGSITIIPSPPPEAVVDGGAGDAAAASGGSAAGYVLAVVLPASMTGQLSRLVTIDPLPLIRGAGASADYPDAGDGGIDRPGALTPCTILAELPLSGSLSDGGAPPDPSWSDGVKWLEAGVDAPVPSPIVCTNAGIDSGYGPPALPNPAPQPTAAARAGQFLYVADGALPIIHVFDLSVASEPHEIEPLRATSLAQPSRPVTVGTLAISPPTRDYKRFLYAVDATDSPSSIIVYDITDPVQSPHVPLKRPHSSLVPLQPEDRIIFAEGVSTLAFVQHDWPLAQTASGGVTSGAARTGLLCNPNPNVDLFTVDAAADAQTFSDPGAIYRYSSIAFSDEQLGPTRLRGIFAFATLSNGQVVTIDVDDWDAPCRRPTTMGPVATDAGEGGAPFTSGFTSAIAPPEPDIGNHDGGPLDPYEAPFTFVTNGVPWVTNEVFFPVSEPHRVRSDFPLSDDPTYGIHYPYLVSTPLLYNNGPDGGLGASVSGSIAAGNPQMLATATVYPDPSLEPDGGVGIRLAWEDPTAHIDQTWTVDYEGRLPLFPGYEGDLELGNLPGVEGIAAQAPLYWTLFVKVQGGLVCSKGVEDWDVGQERAAAFLRANAEAGLQAPERLSTWVGDYFQVSDELLASSDPYWSSDANPTDPNDCWVGFNAPLPNGAGPSPPLSDPTDRYNTCNTIFGSAGGDELISRDFPILQAFDDGFVITRFNYPDSSTTLPVAPTTSNRQNTVADPTNVQALKQLKCCFHGQTQFNVRTGGEWVTTGSASGYLHHVTVDNKTDRCVTSCDPQAGLLNSRTIGVAATRSATDFATFTPDRDSALATRNPTFAFFMQHPFVPDPNVSPQAILDGGIPMVVARPARDFTWQFALKGELQPLTINLAATNTSVSPESMLFIPSLGQLAVVDGSQTGEGLILIDLNTVAVTGLTYY